MIERITKSLCVLVTVTLIASTVSAATSVEIRGQISNEGSTVHEWNVSTFPAFWYDLKGDLRSETLTIDSGESLTSSDRDLDENHLTYTIQRTLKKYKVQSNKALTVENGLNSAGTVVSYGTHYGLVGFFGTKKVAVKGDAGKLTKLILKQGDTAEKVLTIGETWDMSEGWTLTAEAIDARATARLAWLTLKRNNETLDSKVLSQNEVYTYTENIVGLTDAPLFVTYVDGILSGSESDIVILKYTWLISTDIINIKTSDVFGVFKVNTANDTHIVMKNENAVSLDQNAVVSLAEDIQFKVADKSNVLRLYPRKVIELEPISVETEKVTTSETTSEKPASTPTETTMPKETIKPKETVENQETTSAAKTETETQEASRFGILLAGFVVTVATIVYKKQNKK